MTAAAAGPATAPRILGLETELGLMCTARTARGERLGPEETARHLFRSVVRRGQGSSIFLRNGARLYLDVGSHPEYATAECTDVDTLLAHDRAGESEMLDLAADAEEALAEAGTPGTVHLFKNNVDSAGNSFGCHENYLVRRGDLRALTDALVPFLVSRQLVCGAGGLQVDRDGTAVFHLSQRAGHMDETVSSATTRSRPIVNARDEPHADASRYRRLHVIVGDSNLSEPTARLKIVSTDLVLRLIETGARLGELMLHDPLAAIRAMSADPRGRATVRLAGGRTVTALDLQREYLARCLDLAGREGLASASVAESLDLWGRALDAIGRGSPQEVAQEIEWVAKERLLARHADRLGVGLGDPRVRRVALAWHDIDPGRGVFRRLEQRGLAHRLTTDEAVASARVTPPLTRAHLRGRFLAAAERAGRQHVVDWVHLRLLDGTPRTVALHDPFAHEDERVDRLIAGLRPADTSSLLPERSP